MNIEIRLNGKKEVLAGGLSIAELLKEKNIRPEVVTVELNEQIINRDNFTSTYLKDNDAIEFVYFMGGGAH